MEKARYGYGDFVYEAVEDWGVFPEDAYVGNVPDACVDKDDNVFILLRNENPILELTADGKTTACWGKNMFARPHGIYIDDESYIWLADDTDHTVRKLDKDHNVLMTLGTEGVGSDTGISKPRAWKTIKQAAGPFNSPTAVCLDGDKNIYVADGYGNCRIHKFSPQGELLKSWGDIGDKPSCFAIPHSVAILDDTLYVCDRQNYRIQLFDLDGNFKASWPGFYRPAKIVIKDRIFFICENVREAIFNPIIPNRITVCDEYGTVLSHIEGPHRYADGDPYHCTHGMAIDSQWNLYVCDICKKPVDGFVGIHKFKRV